jgi:hypothetical protein
MYQFSRAIYRELAHDISPDSTLGGPSNHEQVLQACERAVLRLATDPHYFAKPCKTLFNDIRVFFPMTVQQRVYLVVDKYLALCRQWLIAQPATGYDQLGNRLECRATTRKGRPCQRVPLPHNGYCPSHQHLSELDEEREFAVAA